MGVNMMEFCKQFNERTQNLVTGVPTPVVLHAFADRTFTFETKTPPASWFLKRCANITKGSARPGHTEAGSVTLKQVFEIAKVKHVDAEHVSLEQMVRSVSGSAKSMGLRVDVDGGASTAPATEEGAATGEGAQQQEA